MHEVEIDAGCLKRFYTIVFPSIIGIATSGLIFEFIYFFPSIETPSRKIFLETISIFFYTMSMISYYFAIHIKNTLPKTLIPPRIKLTLKNNHTLYTEKKTCPKENEKFKPKRTSHCHSCGCVARMDHHCPYTNNCVGGRSLKAFILFCLYGGLFALEFIVLSMVFYYKLSDGTAEKLSEIGITIWMILTIVAIFLAFSMISLSLTNLVMAGKNITQLEVMKGMFRFNDKHGSFPNPFDLGLFTNLNTIFGGDYWLFWFPTEIKSDCDFTEYPMRPHVTEAQIKELPSQIQTQLEDPYVRTIPKTIEELRKREEANYEGVVFFYLGKPYQLMREELKETLADIHNSDEETEVKIEGETEGESDKKGHTEEEKEILANIYDD